MVVMDSEELAALRGVITRCRKCDLSKTRTNVVPGEGPADADIMFIGEAPGRQEDLQGRPFVGRAGSLLDELLDGVGVERGRVFIGNVLKCRPTSPLGKDRRPRAEEVSACAPYLDRQVEIIKPRVICTLGDTASSYILGRYGFKPDRIGRVHGKVFIKGALRIVPSYHPAAALYRFQLRETMEEDFRKLRDLLKQSFLESS
ncbi:MAG: uracil-DNA glycosylase family protein [Candidatus Geothermarchaeales archaeon]